MWIYTLTGNPLENDFGLNYPGLGVSNNEIYIKVISTEVV